MTLIKKFNKRHDQEVRIAVENYCGKDYIDIRVYFENDDGEFLPTKKGIRISKDLLGELEDGIQKLRAHDGGNNRE